MNKPKTNFILNDEELQEAAECLKLMAHPVRLRIGELLVENEYSVGEIAEFCNCSPNQTCEHLRHMLRHGLLSSERRGRKVYYKATSLRLHNLTKCLLNTCLQKQNDPNQKG